MKIKKIKEKLNLYKMYFNLYILIRGKKKIFFFPYYHIGGAEKVHLDILNSFDKKEILTFITNHSINNGFKQKFEESTPIYNLTKLNIPYRYHDRFYKMLMKILNLNANRVYFGCNSPFFYENLNNLHPNSKKIDLIHAFSYEEEKAPEKISLPNVEIINTRIVLGKKTYSDFEKLYHENNISLKFLNRIKIIKNKVNVPNEFPLKPNNEKLKILFVGRNSYEKRPEIFFKIAQKSLDINLSVEFTIIGDFEKNMKVPENVSIVGLIQDENILNSYYLNADLLLITSSREGFPMVILESMAYGVIPITTNVGEINEFINSNNQNGYLIENHNDEEEIVVDFIKQIELLLNNNTLLKETQLKAYTTIANNYKTEVFIREYKNIFKN